MRWRRHLHHLQQAADVGARPGSTENAVNESSNGARPTDLHPHQLLAPKIRSAAPRAGREEAAIPLTGGDRASPRILVHEMRLQIESHHGDSVAKQKIVAVAREDRPLESPECGHMNLQAP
jgi:hypothetical protein